MAREILSGFGSERKLGGGLSGTAGGITTSDKRDVMGYQPPKGPIGIDRTGVGLGGANCGYCGSQGKSEANGDGATGKVGLGGDRPMKSGTQGRY